jgi:hypothetical protein
MPTPATQAMADELMTKRQRKAALESQIAASTSEAEAERAFGSEYAQVCDEVESLQNRLMDAMADYSDSFGPTGTSNVMVDGIGGTRNPASDAISNALYSRMTGKPPADANARHYMGRSLLEIGREVLEASGERTGFLDKARLADMMLSTRDMGGMHGTSDFPTLLTAASNRVLMDSYQQAAPPLKQLCRPRTASDFRAISLVRLSEAPALLKVNEHGEVKYGTRSEAKEAFSLATFARIFSISREALINDDLNAFGDAAAAFGRAAAETEANELLALLTANSGAGVSMDDGNPVFTTARGNKASAGSAITIASLGEARKALRNAKGLDGVTPIAATPKYLLVGSAKETEAEQLLATTTYAAQITDANPFVNKLTILVEPRLQGNVWYLFADPAEIANFTFAYLSGAEGPQFQTRQGWTTLGLEMRGLLDFGCGAQDWRGGFLNPGA